MINKQALKKAKAKRKEREQRKLCVDEGFCPCCGKKLKYKQIGCSGFLTPSPYCEKGCYLW